jgi:hypothetical protein
MLYSRMGLLNPEGVSSVPSPLDVVNFGCYNRPVLIRVKKRYFTPAMLPPEHQPNLPPELAALNNTPDGPNAPISPMAIQPQSQWMPNVNRFKDQELASRNKEESPDDLLDLSDDNLVSIMTTGAKVRLRVENWTGPQTDLFLGFVLPKEQASQAQAIAAE